MRLFFKLNKAMNKKKLSWQSKKYKLIALFFCGFVAGIWLEIFLIERQKETLVQFSDSLKENVNVSCLVLMKRQHMRYVNSSRKTWLKHCSNYKIVKIQKFSKSLESKFSKPLLNLCSENEFQSMIKDYNICVKNELVREIFAKNAWAGLCRALHSIKSDHSEWLVIIPDSSVVLVENLKIFVRNFNCDENHYYGYALKNYEADYNVISAGILLSRGTVRKILEKFNTEEDCDASGKYWRNEDLYLGKYLKQMNIYPKDSRDEEGKGRFHGYNMNSILWPGKLFLQSDYIKKALYPVSQGFNCCSPFLITVEVSDPDAMNNLYYLLYKLKTVHTELPKKIQINKTEGTYWKSFLREEGYSEAEIENITNEEYYKIWEKKLPESKMYEDMHNFLKINTENFD